MRIARTQLNQNPFFSEAIDNVAILKDPYSVDLFDQNGYHLTEAEQAYLPFNGYECIERRHEDCLRYDWIVWDKKEGAHINHSDIFERKGFSDNAKEQLLAIAGINPMLYKLVKMKPNGVLIYPLITYQKMLFLKYFITNGILLITKQ